MADVAPEPTVNSEMVFKGKLIQVTRDEVRLPNGRTTQREIVHHQPTIAVVPVLDDGRIVFVRQFRKPAERVLLELPAGGIDEGEGPEDAVRREMKEETGYDVGSISHVAGFFTSPGFTTEYMDLYVAEKLTPGEPTEETDLIEVVPLSLDEALQHLHDKQFADAKTMLGLVWYARSRGR